MDFIQTHLPLLEHLGMAAYWVAFGAAFFESLAFLGLFIPGTSLVILLGFLASEGAFDFGDLIWFAAAGAILGDFVSYLMGRHGKRFFKQNNRIFKLETLSKGEAFFKKRGNKSVFFGRFFGPMRAVVPFIAGLCRMKLSSFFFWNISSAFLWSVLYLSLGYFFGAAFDQIVFWTGRVGFGLSLVVALILLLYYFRNFLSKNARELYQLARSLLKGFANAFVQNPEWIAWKQRHPHTVALIASRFSKKNFTGLPLTLLTVAFLYTLSVLLGIVEDVLTSDPIVTLDLQIETWIAAHRNLDMTAVFFWITQLGSFKVILGFSIITLMGLFLRKKKIEFMSLLFSVLGCATLTALGKEVFARPRPLLHYYTETSFSFPSGHSSMSVVFYGMLTYFLLRKKVSLENKIFLSTLSFSLVLLIGFSRIYLGVHYLSDVLGGLLLGLLWLIIGITFYEYGVFKAQQKSPQV